MRQSRRLQRTGIEAETFDMTPVIDVVFLLIIFFMLVCQFIAAEQYKVAVPDQIQAAQTHAEKKSPVVITVMEEAGQGVVCIVGTQRLAGVGPKELAVLVRTAVDEALASGAEPTVRLRCDKSIQFGQVKHILSGISNSKAEYLDWAVVK